MARIPLIENKQSLAPQHRAVYDAIVKSRGEVRGCFPALLHVPTIADHTASLGGYLRFDGKLEPKVRALAALTTSRELDCIHEWAAGVRNAEKNGINPGDSACGAPAPIHRGTPARRRGNRRLRSRSAAKPSGDREGFPIDADPLRRRRFGRTHGNHRLLFHDLVHAQCLRAFLVAQSQRFSNLTCC